MTQTNHAKVYTKRKKNHIQQSFNVVIEMNGPVAKDGGCGGGGEGNKWLVRPQGF